MPEGPLGYSREVKPHKRSVVLIFFTGIPTSNIEQRTMNVEGQENI